MAKGRKGKNNSEKKCIVGLKNMNLVSEYDAKEDIWNFVLLDQNHQFSCQNVKVYFDDKPLIWSFSSGGVFDEDILEVEEDEDEGEDPGFEETKSKC